MTFDSREAFISAVKEKLPRNTDVQRVCENLGRRLDRAVHTLAQLETEGGESLAAWHGWGAASDPEEHFKVRLVIGESRTEHRGERNEWPDKMVRAASTDGALGFELSAGLLLPGVRSPAEKRVDFAFLVDEWDQTPQELNESHAVVVGTGEVNIVSMFLQRLLPETIKVNGESDRLDCLVEGHWHRILRSPGGGCEDHPGFVLLLRNPWNLQKRILWVGGVTGVATAAAAQLFLSLPTKHPDSSARSVGVVFKSDRRKTRCHIVAWLRWREHQLICQPPGEETGQRLALLEGSSEPVESAPKDRKGVPREEANISVRRYLKSHPQATIEEVKQATGASVGGIHNTTAWQAHMAKKKSSTLQSQLSSERTRQLTDKALKSIGREDDPSDPLALEEALLTVLLERAKPEERKNIRQLPSQELGELLCEVFEQLADQITERRAHRAGSADEDATA